MTRPTETVERTTEALPASGDFSPPPPDAPREVTQPLAADAGGVVYADGSRMTPSERARQNERELAPLLPQGKSPSLAESIIAARAGELDPFYVNLEKQQAAERAVAPERVTETLAHAPAASNSESPTRGAPGTVVHPARKTVPPSITGGFGDAQEAQYYAISGDELRVIVGGLLDDLEKQIANDLRFHIGLQYPRLSVTLNLKVEGEVAEQGFQIEKVVRKDKTPIDVAQALCDSIVFVVTAKRREFNELGESETPPDAMREEVNLVRPQKQAVKMGVGRQIVDRPGW